MSNNNSNNQQWYRQPNICLFWVKPIRLWTVCLPASLLHPQWAQHPWWFSDQSLCELRPEVGDLVTDNHEGSCRSLSSASQLCLLQTLHPIIIAWPGSETQGWRSQVPGTCSSGQSEAQSGSCSSRYPLPSSAACGVIKAQDSLQCSFTVC